MKYALIFVCCFATVAMAFDAENAHFLPKAFYRIDSNGHKSDVHPVSPHIAHYLRRLRRDVVSASSSSSSSSNGGPVFFTQSQTVQHAPDVSVASRFGGAPSGPVGHVVQTTGVIDADGRVHYTTNRGVLGNIFQHSSTPQH